MSSRRPHAFGLRTDCCRPRCCQPPPAIHNPALSKGKRFAVGLASLSGHLLAGEERFAVELQGDGSVWCAPGGGGHEGGLVAGVAAGAAVGARN
jgi:hypothetical protein